MDKPGDAEDADSPHEDGHCLPAHDGVHYFTCGNLICDYYNRVQKCAVPGKEVYAKCKCCGTLERIVR